MKTQLIICFFSSSDISRSNGAGFLVNKVCLLLINAMRKFLTDLLL